MCPVPAGTHSGSTFSLPFLVSPVSWRFTPTLCLNRLLRVKRNKGQMCKVTRSSSTRVHTARLWGTHLLLWDCQLQGRVWLPQGSALMGLRPLQGPSIHIVPLSGTAGHVPSPWCIRYKVHSVSLFEAENGTPTGEPSLGCMHKARGCPKRTADHPAVRVPRDQPALWGPWHLHHAHQ